MPLVGIWISGVSNVLHPLCLSSAIYFMYCRNLGEKALPSNNVFLVLCYPVGEIGPKLYECEITGDIKFTTMYLYSFKMSKSFSLNHLDEVKIDWKKIKNQFILDMEITGLI